MAPPPSYKAHEKRFYVSRGEQSELYATTCGFTSLLALAVAALTVAIDPIVGILADRRKHDIDIILNAVSSSMRRCSGKHVDGIGLPIALIGSANSGESGV